MQFSLLSALVVAGATLSGLASPVAVPRGQEASNGTASLSKRFSSSRWSFYDVGLGACGETNVATDYIVALNTNQFGTGYPGPYCGKTITMSYGGKTATATIMDSCPGCPYGGLDLSRGLFQHFASEDVGIVYGEWEFTDGTSATTSTKAAATTTTHAATTTRAATTRATTTQTPTTVKAATTSSTHTAAPTTHSTTHATTHSTTYSPTPSSSSESSTRFATQRLDRVSSSVSHSSTHSASASHTASATSSVASASATLSAQETFDQNVKLLSQAIQQLGSVFEKLFGESTSVSASATATATA
ncbi:hypothetical protein MD484_g3219, partial [Candolleomyces efflorescens]